MSLRSMRHVVSEAVKYPEDALEETQEKWGPNKILQHLKCSGLVAFLSFC